MHESVAIAKEADAKKDFSPTMSDKSAHRVQHEPERQLGSLRGVIDNIRHDGGTPSVESIATELSGRHSPERASVLLALQRTHGNRYVQRVVAGIQAKLKVGQPGDIYEQEAERVGEEITLMRNYFSIGPFSFTSPDVIKLKATRGRAVPFWNHLPNYAQNDLIHPGYGKNWFEKKSDEVRLTVLNLYVKLKGMRLWNYVRKESSTHVGRLEFEADVQGLKQDLRARWNFRDPEASAEEWDSSEKRVTGVLHFKHFKGWPLSKVQAHIDQAGLWLGSKWFWWAGTPVTGIRHLLGYESYQDVFGIRDILLQQGWDPRPLLGTSTGVVRRKALPDSSTIVDSKAQSHILALSGRGQPLPESARNFFEPRFGYDFSQVRVHTDATAAETARALNARAFTVGRDVVFGAGQYAPETSQGKKLLAHELTHVVQQGSHLNSNGIFFKGISSTVIQLQTTGEHEAVTTTYPTETSISIILGKPILSTQTSSDPLSSYPFLQKVLDEKDTDKLRKPLKIRTRIRQLQKKMYQFAKKEGIPIWPPYGLTRAGVIEKMENYHERIRLLRLEPHPDDLELAAMRLCYRDDIAPSPSDPNHIKLAKDRIIARLGQMKARIFVEDPYAGTDTDNRIRIFLDKYEVSQTLGEVHFKDLLSISEFKSIVSEEEAAEKRREEERARKAIEREKKRVQKVRSSEEFENLGWSDFTTDFILDYAFQIKAEANKQNIDPIAIAGVVAWEREVNWKGYWSDVLWQRRQCAKGTISQTAGIGYGSIHLDVAEAIEKAGRVPAAVSIRIRCQRLQDPTWAIRYIAAIMNQDAENYERIARINIRKQPDILATLYRTGKSKEKAMKKKEEIDRWEKGRRKGPRPKPVPDEMGRWINTKSKNLNFLLKGG